MLQNVVYTQNTTSLWDRVTIYFIFLLHARVSQKLDVFHFLGYIAIDNPTISQRSKLVNKKLCVAEKQRVSHNVFVGWPNDRAIHLSPRMLYDYSVSQKSIPLRFSDIFPKPLGIFVTIFYTPIIRSYLR